MLKGLLVVLAIILIVLAILVLMIGRFFLSIINKMRRAARGEDDEDEDFVGRRSTQYTFKGNEARKQHSQPTGGQPGQSNSSKQSNKRKSKSNDGRCSNEGIVSDMRSPEVANRKIIDPSEGEYVDFEEEDKTS